MSSAFDDEPPPLEDLTDEIEARLGITVSNHTTSKQTAPQAATENEAPHAKSVEPKTTPSEKTQPSPQKQSTSTIKSKDASFGGFKKGFLFGAPPKKSPSSNANPTATPKSGAEGDIPLIKKREDDSSMRFKEVQDNVQPSWINDNLLQNVAKDGDLMRKMDDPRYSAILKEFQESPEVAMRKYANDKDVMEFFRKFMSLLGNHFTTMTPPEGASTPEPEPLIREAKDPDTERMEAILKQPEVREAVSNPAIKELFELLRNNPNAAQQMLFQQRTNQTFQKHVKLLVDNGLLSFAS